MGNRDPSKVRTEKLLELQLEEEAVRSEPDNRDDTGTAPGRKAYAPSVMVLQFLDERTVQDRNSRLSPRP